jgi:AcrR family transcriptional regulator
MSDDHVRRLWRHRGTTVPGPRRGPQKQLDLDEILDAAIAIADADGLAAVSTRAVATRFGKTAMALYAYVGTKDHLLALMQDHASAMPAWPDPGTTLADDLRAWAENLFDLQLAHPWLAERPWSQSAQGPNERDWLERVLGILNAWNVPIEVRTPAITTLYATVRACAETAASYRRIDPSGAAEWLAEAEETRRQLPDLSERYPLTAGLPPITHDWREAPRAGVRECVRLLACGLS